MVESVQNIEIEVAWDGPICPYCGQQRQEMEKICNVCAKQMNSVVLAICRELLINAGQTKKIGTNERIDKEFGKDVIQELEIHQVLDHFPFEFSKRTQKYPKALRTEGVWFSHLVAYQFMHHLRAEKNLAPPLLVCDPMYQFVRDQVFSLLQNPQIDTPTREAFENVYAIPDASLDARRVILEMMEELERIGRIRIIRPKTYCRKCEKELNNGKMICPECEKDEMLNNRLAISSGMPQPLISSKESDAAPKTRGMYIKE